MNCPLTTLKAATGWCLRMSHYTMVKQHLNGFYIPHICTLNRIPASCGVRSLLSGLQIKALLKNICSDACETPAVGIVHKLLFRPLSSADRAYGLLSVGRRLESCRGPNHLSGQYDCFLSSCGKGRPLRQELFGTHTSPGRAFTTSAQTILSYLAQHCMWWAFHVEYHVQ